MLIEFFEIKKERMSISNPTPSFYPSHFASFCEMRNISDIVFNNCSSNKLETQKNGKNLFSSKETDNSSRATNILDKSYNDEQKQNATKIQDNDNIHNYQFS